MSKKFQKQSTEHCTVFSCTHKGALRERTVLQTEGKGGEKIQFLVKINKLKDGTKNPVEAAVEPKKYCVITGT